MVSIPAIARAVERLESQHRPHDPFDGPVVLLDDVVQILDSPQFDVGTGVSPNALDGRLVGAALVDGDLLRYVVQLFDALAAACLRHPSAEQKVDIRVIQVLLGHKKWDVLPTP